MAAYDSYLNYLNKYGNIFSGFIFTDYVMLRDEILKNHDRKISYDSEKGLYRTYLDNKTMITAKTKEGLEDKIFCWYLDHNSGVFSFPQVLMRSLVFHRNADFLSQPTIDRYMCDYRKYLKDSMIFNQDIRCITESDIYQFFNEIMKEKPTAKNVSNIKTVIRLAFNYARIQENIECLFVNTIFHNMQYPKRSFSCEKETINRVFSTFYRDKLFSVMDDTLLDRGIRFDFYTGLRVGELCSLRYDDFHLDDSCVIISRSESVSGTGKDRMYFDSAPKCYKERSVILSDHAKECFDLQVEKEGFVFPFRDSHYHKCSFDTRLRTLCKRADLPSFSMHDIRRTYASMLLDIPDVSEKFVQEQLGHSDIKITQKYYYYTTKHKTEYLEMANKI